MPSSYSPNLRIELIASGEQANTWGNTTNTNLGTLIEQAISGYVALNSMSDANYTLTALNGAADQARQMFLDIPAGTTLTATRFVLAPAVPKVYVVRNSSTGGQSITIATATSGVTGVTVPNGRTKMVACDGTNFTEVTTSLNKLYLETAIDYATSAANQAVTKTYVDTYFLRLAGNNTVTGNTTFSGTVTLPSSTPTGYQATSFSYVNSNYLWKASGGPSTQDVYPYLRLQYTPVNAADAVPKTYVDSNFVDRFTAQSIAGVKTFTSSMALSGAGVQLTLPNAPTSGTDAANKSYVDGSVANFVTLTGGAQTITSPKTFGNNIAVSSPYQISVPAASSPAGNDYVTNKAYVDGAITTAINNAAATIATLYTPLTRTITAGTGLSGGGTLQADRTISLAAASTTVLGGIKYDGDTLKVNGTGQLYVDVPPSGVQTITIASANGLAGTSSGGLNPQLTLSVSSGFNGLLKGSAGAISQATASDVTSLIGGTTYYPYSSNPASYVTSSSLSTTLTGYLTTTAASSTYLTQTSASNTYLANSGTAITTGAIRSRDSSSTINYGQMDYAYDSSLGAYVYAQKTYASSSNYNIMGWIVVNNTGVGRPVLYTGTAGNLTVGASVNLTVSTLTSNGPVYSSGGTLTNTAPPSDARLKDEIQDIPYGLSEVLQLRPVNFIWKSDTSARQCWGFIAQEVEQVMPACINKNKLLNSEETGDEEEYYHMDPVAVNVALVKAVQELNAKVEAQAAEIAALKGA